MRLLPPFRIWTIAVIVVTSIVASCPTQLRAQGTVDYSYAPAHWLTPIGLVDDWHKSLADHLGRLAYDFGPGPYARPQTTVAVSVRGAEWDDVNQNLLDARVPIVVTRFASDSSRLVTTTYSLVPENDAPAPKTSSDGSYIRHQGHTGSLAWGSYDNSIDPAFHSVAWGTGRLVHYSLKVSPGEGKRVALGFRETYRSGRIKRTMTLDVEGATRRDVDLLKTGAQNEAQVFFFDGDDVDEDGWIDVKVGGAESGQDPNIYINAIWAFQAGASFTVDDVRSGRATVDADVFVNCGTLAVSSGLSRTDAVQGTLEGDGELVVEVRTNRVLGSDQDLPALTYNSAPFIATDPPFTSATTVERGWDLSFAPGVRSVAVVANHGADGYSTVPDLAREKEKVADYWATVPLPWGKINVPDKDIQDLLDGGIRTVYQVRDVVDDYAQFQPGPSVYRGLWYGDGMWGAETAAFLGDADAARQTLEAMLMHQEENGRSGVMKPALLHRETAHMMYGICRYARLMQDWDWLDANWANLSAAMVHLMDLRRQASLDSSAVYFGLMPPGLTDGGIGGIGSTYGSTYWALIAMAEAARTAEARGKPEAEAWRLEFDDFHRAFRRAAARDTTRDEFGNLFLPMKMDYDSTKDVAQRGQWGPLHAMYAGQFLDSDEPLMQGTFKMLEAREKENHVLSLGWLTGGVWPIFEAHRAIAYLYANRPDDAERQFYSFANHSSPTLVWIEEQMPKAEGRRTTGDVPHTVGNMQVARVLRYMLLMERGADLQMMAGLPLSFIKPGARLSGLSLPTLFGPATIRLIISPDGNGAELFVDVPASGDGIATVDLRRLKQAGFSHFADGRRVGESVDVDWGSRVIFQLVK